MKLQALSKMVSEEENHHLKEAEYDTLMTENGKQISWNGCQPTTESIDGYWSYYQIVGMNFISENQANACHFPF